VAGVAALVMSLNPSLSGTDVRTLLEQSADDLGSAGWDPSYGYGRVNAYKAVLAAGGAPPDTTPPTAALSSPTNGAAIFGSISVAVTGTDNVGVTKLEWYLDGVLQGSNNTASASFSWNTATAVNGSHTLQAKAYDAAGNSGTSALITVNVDNLVASPTASVAAPSSGSTVSNSVSVDVVATDTVTITNVQWYLDGSLQGSSANPTPTFSWNTTNCANGSHTLQAKAYDAAGSMGVSALVSVTVSNADITPPTATITGPADGSTVSGSVSINVSGTDNVGVAEVEWYLDGVFQASSPTASASFSWDTTSAPNGSHTLLAKAYDAAGNVGSSAAVSVTVNNPDITPPTATITGPADGSTVSGSVSINVSGTDNVGVTEVEWYLDGVLQASSASASASFSWDTTSATNGTHTVLAKAYDAAGNVGSSAAVTLNVQNSVPDTTPPTVAVTSPPNGFTVTTRYTPVSVTSSDNIGVVKVAFLVDGKTYATSTSATPVFNWYTAKLSRGSHTLQALASDAAGNSTRSAVVTVRK
jgi:carbon monoxide dehydrogenase subunit G